ncbi:MAG: hypothetical protein H7329_17700 [Opitutaceae bacterium]|nr:hypothetical protein [Cytophagales bacterium]
MDKKKDKLENWLQNKLEEQPEPMNLDKEWLRMEDSLDGRAFLKFRWNRFNIYYLATWFATMCVAGTALYRSYKTDYYLPMTTGNMQADTVFISKTIHDTVWVGQLKVNKVIESRNSFPSESSSKLESHVEDDPQPEIVPTIVEIPVVSEEKHKEISRPIVYQYKRDTIFKFDSVKVSKRELKKLRKTH